MILNVIIQEYTNLVCSPQIWISSAYFPTLCSQRNIFENPLFSYSLLRVLNLPVVDYCNGAKIWVLFFPFAPGSRDNAIVNIALKLNICTFINLPFIGAKRGTQTKKKNRHKLSIVHVESPGASQRRRTYPATDGT